MATLTLSIPDEVKKRLDAHPDINLPEYLKGRLNVKIAQLRKFEEMVSRGEL